MALGPQRQLFNKILSLASQRAGEAGGIVSRVASSGVEVVGYVIDIANVYPIGVQIHDVEHIDEGYQYNPWRDRGVRRVSKPEESVAISTHCIVDTNFVEMTAQPNSGKKAYLAPSGLITDDASLGGAYIGDFMSDLNGDVPGLPRGGAGPILVFGGGFERGQHIDYQQPRGHRIVNEQVEEEWYNSPGWVRVRIKL
jgi:hypothetical protein